MSAGNILYGVLSYNQVKAEDDHAKVILTNRMIEPDSGIYDINTSLGRMLIWMLWESGLK
jgi:hypothetical protein